MVRLSHSARRKWARHLRPGLAETTQEDSRSRLPSGLDQNIPVDHPHSLELNGTKDQYAAHSLRHSRPGYEFITALLTLAAALPATVILLWRMRTIQSHWLVCGYALALIGWPLWIARVAWRRMSRPWQTLSNVLASFRANDFSIRMHAAHPGGAMGAAVQELGLFAQTLQAERYTTQETSHLLGKVMAEIDVAVLTFDAHQLLQLANPAAERLLASERAAVIGKSASEIGLLDCLLGAPVRTLQIPGHTSHWELHRAVFRTGGAAHTLVVLNDVSGLLREQERASWQRLIRVLGHELNNSLAPIQSLAGTLQQVLRTSPRSSDWENDMESGLAVISNRAQAVTRFLQAYARLARLPLPSLAPLDIPSWLQTVIFHERRWPIRIEPGPPVHVLADRDQMDHLLINLLRNAAEASLQYQEENRQPAPASYDEPLREIVLRWRLHADSLLLEIEDGGPGLNTSNLFVPFFTTKPEGSGIGLVLIRQIAEAHGGTLQLLNRADEHPYAHGCRALLQLPLPGS